MAPKVGRKRESCSSSWFLNRPKFHGATDFHVKAALASLVQKHCEGIRGACSTGAIAQRRERRGLAIEHARFRNGKRHDKKHELCADAQAAPKRATSYNVAHKVHALSQSARQCSAFFENLSSVTSLTNTTLTLSTALQRRHTTHDCFDATLLSKCCFYHKQRLCSLCGHAE